MSKRILHIGKYFEPFKGGIERVMLDLMIEQQNRGFDVLGIVHHHETYRSQTYERISGLQIYRLPIIGRLAFVPVAITAVYALFRLIRNIRPDILHLHVPNVLCLLLLLSPHCRSIPWVVHWHSDVIGEDPDWKLKLLYPLYARFEKLLLEQASAIIVTSPQYKESSVPLKTFLAKTVCIPLGLNDHQQHLENRDSQKTDILNILCIGRFTYYKGQKYLVDAMNSLINKGRTAFLEFVGTGEDEQSLLAKIQEYELSKQITILKNLSDEELEAAIRCADVICLPSIERTEAFGVVLLEAMRSGKPCICTSVPGSGMSYVVNDGETGFVVAPSSSQALENALESYIEQPGLLQQHGDNGRKRFEAMFSIDSVTEKVLDIYADL